MMACLTGAAPKASGVLTDPHPSPKRGLRAPQGTSNTSTSPTPVVPSIPLTIAVYDPGARVMRRAASRG